MSDTQGAVAVASTLSTALVQDAAAAVAGEGTPSPETKPDPIIEEIRREEDRLETEGSRSIEPPICLTIPEDPMKPWVLGIYRKDCLTCDVLVPDAEYDGSTMSCHYRRGNINCPGAQVRIMNYGGRMRAAQILREAQTKAANNPMAILEATSNLGKMVTKGQISEQDLSWALNDVGMMAQSLGQQG